jgi:hypothetical protein
VPEDNKMAVRLVQAEEANRAEKQRLKERVLQIDQLSAEAEVCGAAVWCLYHSQWVVLQRVQARLRGRFRDAEI